MFAGNTADPWTSFSRPLWTLVSFTLEVAGVGLLLVLPLIYIGGPPQLDPTRAVFTPLSAMGSEDDRPTGSVARSNRNYTSRILVVRPGTPPAISVVDDRDAFPLVELGIGVPYSAGTLDTHRVIDSIGGTPLMPKPPVLVAHPARVSAIMEGYLIRQVEPVYPPLARAARIQGTVELEALISRQGTIEKLQVLKGHPMLVKAAVDAVSEWRYRPYLLNGEPVEVETHVTVNFSLSRASEP